MVVPVLITSCHVSEKPKSGPLTAHTMTMPAAIMNVEARPAASEVLLARSPKNFETADGSLAFCFALHECRPCVSRRDKSVLRPKVPFARN